MEIVIIEEGETTVRLHVETGWTSEDTEMFREVIRAAIRRLEKENHDD